MTFRDAFRKTGDWQRKVAILSLFHNARLLRNREWKLVDTAKYFKISLGHVSENLKLAIHQEEVKFCESRNKALQQLRDARKK